MPIRRSAMAHVGPTAATVVFSIALVRSCLTPNCSAIAMRCRTWIWLVNAMTSTFPPKTSSIKSETGSRFSGSSHL